MLSEDPKTVNPILKVRNLTKHYPVNSRILHRKVGEVLAVDDVNIDLHRGEILALVGESGCGKSTLARTIMRLHRPTSGNIFFDGQEVTDLEGNALRRYRSRIQIVFQDPYSSLNPRLTAWQLIAEPLRLHGRFNDGGRQRVEELLERVGLRSGDAGRVPSQFSGGQRQRICIARALALSPDVVVLDEPVAALDVSIQAQILNLLLDLQHDLGTSYLFVSHDLSVVHHVAARIAVMYLGRIVETGDSRQIYRSPRHPYTLALLSAVPSLNPAARTTKRRIILTGEVPSPLRPPSGCRFRTRCWKADALCAEKTPELLAGEGEHPVACHHPVDPVVALKGDEGMLD